MSNPIDAMPLAKLLGITLVEFGPEKIVAEMTVRAELCTAGDSVHGGTLMAFADSLGAIGGFLNLPDGANGTTTIESKTNFLGRALAGAKLTGTTTPVSVGKRLSVWQTEIRGEDGRSVALVTQTQLVLA